MGYRLGQGNLTQPPSASRTAAGIIWYWPFFSTRSSWTATHPHGSSMRVPSKSAPSWKIGRTPKSLAKTRRVLLPSRSVMKKPRASTVGGGNWSLTRGAPPAQDVAVACGHQIALPPGVVVARDRAVSDFQQVEDALSERLAAGQSGDFRPVGADPQRADEAGGGYQSNGGRGPRSVDRRRTDDLLEGSVPADQHAEYAPVGGDGS